MLIAAKSELKTVRLQFTFATIHLSVSDPTQPSKTLLRSFFPFGTKINTFVFFYNVDYRLI